MPNHPRPAGRFDATSMTAAALRVVHRALYRFVSKKLRVRVHARHLGRRIHRTGQSAPAVASRIQGREARVSRDACICRYRCDQDRLFAKTRRASGVVIYLRSSRPSVNRRRALRLDPPPRPTSPPGRRVPTHPSHRGTPFRGRRRAGLATTISLQTLREISVPYRAHVIVRTLMRHVPTL